MNVNYDEEHARKKARNVARSCDGCRRRKSDGPSMKGNRCSSCLAYGAECTYVEPAKKRGPPKGYIESMQTRIEKIERLLQTLLPDADLGQFLSESSVPGWKPQGADEDERAHLSLCENLQRLSFSPTQDTRFFGRSSGAMLLQTALNVKKDAQPENSRRHTEFWASRPSPGRIPPAQYTFPPPDLAESLIDLYFDNVNLLLPLLHRPTFDRQVAAGVHLENGGFAATYLLVCAIGSRYSSDPRVLLDGTDNSHSCGWRWFEQLQLTRDPLGPPVSIYDLQTVALAVLFIQGSSAPQASWTLISFGIRIGQDVGAHRRKDADQEWTAEDELWKRAFWVLVYLDRICSSYHGRPSAIHDEDFDLDFPVDCDDEYWEAADPDGRFQQPRDKPSKLSAFIALLRLCQVLSFALRTIYSLNKSKVLLGLTKGTDSDWEQRIVDELNTALDNWIDGLPNHLRWNPEEQRPGFFDQAVALHCSYYNVKMTILRTYIPSPKHIKSFAVSPLALCLNAAKTCLHIVDVHRKRTGNKPLPLVQGAIFVAGLVLALNLWAERPGPLELSTDSSQEIAEIQTCMHALQDCETRWHPAGRLWDILSDLIKGIPLQGNSKPPNKHERGTERPRTVYHQETSDASPSGTTTDGARSGAQKPVVARRRPTLDVSSHILAYASSSASALGQQTSGSSRLHTSNVPDITTQLQTNYHHQAREYGTDTPISASNERYRPDEAHGRPYHPDPPLSATSVHHPDTYSPHHDTYSPHRVISLGPPPDAPLSATLAHGEPYGSSMHHSRPHPSPATPLSGSSMHGDDHQHHLPYSRVLAMGMNYLHPHKALGTRERHEYWYDNNGPAGGASAPPSHHPQQTSQLRSSTSSEQLGSRQGPHPPSFPISEAFYDHVTASFNGHNRPHPGRFREGYSSGEVAYHNLSPSHSRGERDAHERDPVAQETMSAWSQAPLGYSQQEWTPYIDNITQKRMH